MGVAARGRSAGVLALILLLGAPQLSLGAFPGSNGRIVFADEGSLFTVEPDGSKERELAAGANAAFSPDGERIVHSCDGQICVIDADGSDQRQLTTDPTFRSQQPNWSPTGDEIVFTRREIVDTDRSPALLFVIDANGSNERALDEDGNDPVWAPDGRRIAFTKGKQGNGIYLIRPDGTDVKRIHEGEGYVHSLSWAPDGHRVAFTMQRRNFWRIMVVNRDGLGYREIFRGSGSADASNEVSGRGLAWAPNGKRIVYYNIKKDQLCFVRPDGRRAGCIDHSGERPDWGVRIAP